jgi:hypothetical protein
MANTESLHEFPALASSPIRSPARDVAHRAWEDYKIRRQIAAYQSRNAALLTKGSYIKALRHRAIDLTGVDIAAQVTHWAQDTGGRLILGFADLRGVVCADATLGPAWIKGARLSDGSLRRCDFMIPFVPILERGDGPFVMFRRHLMMRVVGPRLSPQAFQPASGWHGARGK